MSFTDMPCSWVGTAAKPQYQIGWSAWWAGQRVQVYGCTAGAWTFTEPAAALAGRRNAGGAVHFRGPSWESTEDGSLVGAKAASSAKVTGSGVFGGVTYIQRLATRGGTAPSDTRTEGATTGVRYTAEYRLFKPAN